MNVPPYLYSEDFKEQQLFFELIFQAMFLALSDRGWTVPQLTTAQIVNIAPQMPDGCLWYDISHAPPVFVGKVNGALVQFVTAAYP